jgi:multiple sugar transport system substrate-binding protein
MGHTFPARRISRRGFLGGVAASAGAAILAACGGSSATDTPKPASTAATTGGATSPAGSAAVTRPVGSAVTGTSAAGSPAVSATRPAGSAVSGTTAAGTATSGTTTASTGPLTLLPTPSPDKFKGQALQVISRQEYFKEVETAFDAELQKFAQMTGTKIENNRVNQDTGQVVSKMDAAVKAGNAPDFAYFDRFVPELYQLGDIIEVSDVVNTIQDAYGAAEDNVKINATVGGKWYGIPYSTQGAGYFARKDWLDEKGIKVSDIKTWENLRDAALEISDPSRNRYGWGLTVNQSGDANGLIQGVINAYGGAGASDDGKKAILNSPETVAAVTFLADIYTNPKYKNMLPPGVLSWTDTGNNEAWLAGVIGFTTNQFSLYAQSKATKNPVYDKTVVFPSVVGPAVDRPLAFGNYTYFVIFKGAKNPDLAKALAQYLVAGQPLLNMVKPANGLILPAYKKVWDSDPYYLNGDPVFAASRTVVEQPLPIASKTGLHFPQSPSPAWQQAYNSYVLTDMMGQIIQKGIKPADAVKQAYDRSVQAFEQLGFKQ